ncbi:MAG: hypothetical protein CMF96_05775 [Candidatus Marinimicrobia bacterium]|nr:hypothetical protein [Candidatus Neomarinimicrobiota bacterium]|tara:strand:- start:3436 stop:4071 length:636 start_codon:yes stop_codon:yes gene_type:complete
MKIYYIALIFTFLLNFLKTESYYEYWPNDSIKIEGEYLNGYKSGKWEYYNLNGKVWKYEIFKNGKLIDQMTWHIFKPKKLKIDSSNSESSIISNIENKDIVNLQLKDSTKNKNSFLEGYTGTWIEYHDNGVLNSVIQYMNGLKHGKANYYDENERLTRTERYLSGKKHGKWIWHGENNRVKEAGYYNMNKKHGKWIIYDKAGNQISVKDFN